MRRFYPSPGQRWRTFRDVRELPPRRARRLAGSGGEPTVATAEAGLAAAKAAKADVVIGLGGGSAVDTGKAIAALMTQPEGLMAYMEVVGQGKALVNPSLPFIAVPTTAGTGSEARRLRSRKPWERPRGALTRACCAQVTKNSVFDSPEANVKASIRSNYMLPALAVVDPLLTLGVPRDVTAATGLDALTQCLEPFVCNACVAGARAARRWLRRLTRARSRVACALPLARSTNPLTDAISLEGLRRAGRSLRAVCADGSNLDAREDLCVASLCGGLSLANAKLGAVHGFAGPLGGMLHGPHGALCAAMLPAACAVNVELLSAGGAAAAPALARFTTVARVLTGREDACAADGVAWLAALCKELAIPGLAAYGMSEARVAEAVAKGKQSSSMKGNPVPLTDAQMADILRRSM